MILDSANLVMSWRESRMYETRMLVRRIINALEIPLTIGDLSIQIEISIGISIFPSDAQSIDELYDLADRSMYTAKESAGTTYAFTQDHSQ